MDAFADIAKWHEAEEVFRECEFIVAKPSRLFAGGRGQRVARESAPQAGTDEVISEAGG